MHLVRWDARRLRFLIATWLVVVIASAIVTGVRPLVAADPSLRESMAVVSSLLWLTTLLFTFAMVSFIVHGHPAVGSDAFWMTRPIRPSSLLASKVILAGLTLVVAEAITDAILLAANKMPASISAGVILQDASTRTVIIVVLMAGAALTRNLPRFALLCGATLLTLIAAVGVFIAIQFGRLEDEPPLSMGGGTEDPTSFVVFNVVLIAAAVALLVVQYRTRLRRRSVAVGALGLVAAIAISDAWPVPFLAPRLVVPAWAHKPTALVVAVDAATISTNTPHSFFPERSGQWSTVNGVMRVTGVESGWTASVALRDASIDLPQGMTLRSPGRARWSVTLVGDEGYDLQQPAVVRAILGVVRVGNVVPPRTGPPPPEALPALFWMRQRELAQYVPARAHYRARLVLTLTEHVVDGTLPLRPGAVHRNNGYRLVIDRITRPSGEVAIIARETRAASMWQRRPWPFYSFYLRNRDRQEAVAVSDYELRGDFSLLRFLPFGGFHGVEQTGGFFARGLVLSFRPRYGPKAETLDVDDEWLAGADLVIVRRAQEGSVERTLEITDFPIGNAPTRVPS
jgi:hypothetical protein